MSLEGSLEGENKLLRKELETITQIKNNEILELRHQLEKAHLLHKIKEERIGELQHTVRGLQQKNNHLQLFSRQRSNALTHKNIKIAQLEEEIGRCVNRQAERWREEVQVLKNIIREQEGELSNYLEDHHNYLLQLEQLQDPYRYLHSERALLLQFNQELQTQIAQSQEAGRQLEKWAAQANEELRHQNEQGNDLLGQIEYMVQEVGRS